VEFSARRTRRCPGVTFRQEASQSQAGCRNQPRVYAGYGSGAEAEILL
jgi:hypothetical protein